MWSDLIRTVGDFPSAVLSARDADGDPASLRTAAAPDDRRHVFGVHVPLHLELQPGPASLLVHSHDAQLWSLRSHSVRGTLERDGDGWLFRPSGAAAGEDSSALATVRALLGTRRAAKKYLARRGLAHPAIPWERLRAAGREPAPGDEG